MSPVSCAMHLIRSKGPRQIAEQNRKKFQCIYHHLFSKCQCQLFQGEDSSYFQATDYHRLLHFLPKILWPSNFQAQPTQLDPPQPLDPSVSASEIHHDVVAIPGHHLPSPPLEPIHPAPGCSPGVTVNIGWTRQRGPWGRCNGDDGLQERPLRRGKHFHQSIRDKLVVAALADQSSPAVQCFSRHIAIWLIAFSSHHYPHLWVSELWIIWEHLSW